MKKNIYFFLSVLFVCGYSCHAYAQADVPPTFTGGSTQNLTVCKNSGTTSINSLLSITDPDVGQTERWTIFMAPTHGSLVAGYTHVSTGGTLTPVGLTYAPATGYSGADSFIVMISDGTATDVTTIYITVNPAPIAGPSGVCVGSSITLTDATGSGLWSSSSGFATVGLSTGVVTGVTAGSVTISYTIGTCVTTTSIAINPISAITGTGAICVGKSLSLSDGSSGGSWSSTDNTIATVISGGIDVGIVTGASAGITTISYIMPTGCAAATTVTVNPVPLPITGTASVCVGATTALSETTGGGTWSAPFGGIATVDPTGIVTGLSAGPVVISYTLPTGCRATKTVVVNPEPTAITGITHFCAGSTTILGDGVTGGSWISSDLTISTVNSTGTATGVSAGTAIITYQLVAGCFTTTPVTVNIAPMPVTGPPNVCIGASIVLSDGVGGGVWSTTGRVATVDPGTGVVAGLTGGTTTISYSIGSCIATKIITVNSISAITGPTVACVGNTLTLSDGSGGGTWTSGDAGIATVTTISSDVGIVTGLAGGTTFISYVMSTGCTAAIVITINPLPSPITGTPVVCQGLTTTLSDATGGGSWSAPFGGIATVNATGLVTGLSAGSAIITYTLPTGCKTTQTVVVNPSPTPITGTARVCAGSSIILGDAVTGGSWSSSDEAIFTVNTAGVVTGASAGTATVTYQLGAGCFMTKLVTVNLTPAPISGPASVCGGSTITLTDGTGGGSWGISGTVATIGGTGIVTGISAGEPVVTYTIVSCIATKTITVNPISPITGSVAFCAGNSIRVNDATGGGTWSSNDVGIATVSAFSLGVGTVTGVSGGTTTISYTMASGCVVTTLVTINPLPAPISVAASVCQGATTTLSDTSGGGTWSVSSGGIATVSAAGVLTGLSAGPAIITYTLPTGCKITRTIIVYASPGPIIGAATICEGSTFTLSDAVPAGAWISSDTSIATINMLTGDLTGVSRGLATISYELGGGCFTALSLTVNLTPSPITGPSSVCTGFSITLRDTTAGGTWSSVAPAVSVNATTGVVTGVAGGTDAVTYKVGSCITTWVLTVNPISPITGGSSICLGTTQTFVDATVFGVWSISDSDLATVATLGFGEGNVTAMSAGVVILSYTVYGCTVVDTLTINPLPAAIGGTAAICQGYTTTLTDPTSGGSWSSGDRSIATIGVSTGEITALSPGTVVITYRIGTGCVITFPFTVNQLPNPIVENAPICVGLSNYLDDAVGGIWTSSDTAVATINPTTGLLTCLSAGITVATFTLPTGCFTTDTLHLKSCDAAVQQVTPDGQEISILPNPNNGEFTVNGYLDGHVATGLDEGVSIEIMSLPGQVVYKDNLVTHNGLLNDRILLSNDLANGLYILSLHSAKGNQVFRIVVQR